MKITSGIASADRATVAALYWEAFGDKLGAILGPKHRALAYISQVLQADHGICAHDATGLLLGVVGFKTHRGALVDGSFADMRRIYGCAGACLRTALMAALLNDTDNERFLIDGIFVAPAARGRGIGTALLSAIRDEARSRGYRQIRLDVVDTNPRAKALYLREGFVVFRTQKMGPWRYLMGFDTCITMVRDV